MAQYAGLSLFDIYARKCEELHCKRNSALAAQLPKKPDYFEAPTSLDLSNNFVGPKGLLAVLEVVRCCTGLISLDVQDQQMTNDSVQAICDVLQHHPSVTTLNVSNNPITIEAGRAILDLVRANPRLERVHLQNTGMRSVMTGAISVQLSKNREAKKPAARAEGTPTDKPTTTKAIDTTAVRDALLGFPNSIAPYIFDVNVTDSLASLCQQYDALFYDTQFPPAPQSIQRSDSRDYGVVDWVRIGTMEGARVFPPEDVAASNWALPALNEVDAAFAWVLTSLYAVAPDGVGTKVKDLLDVSKAAHGLFSVSVFIDGQWRTVVVDDHIPVRKDGTPVFVRPVSGTYYWPCILIKAVAKLHGCFQAIDQSVTNRHAIERKISSSTTMSDFSAGVGLSRSLHHDGFDADEWWGTMLELSGQGAGLVATTDSDEGNVVMQKLNIQSHHAYRVLSVRQINGFRLVQLESRYTDKVWSGDWSAKSPLWEQHEEIASALEFKFAEARLRPSFWLPYLKFLQLFTAMHICRLFANETSRIVEGEWNRTCAGGPYFEPSWHTNPRYKLAVGANGHFFVTLSLPDSRFTVSDVDTLAFHLIRSDTYPLKFDNVLGKTNYVITSSVSYEGMFSADGDIWIVPSSYVTGALGRYLLRVVGSVPFSLSHEPIQRYWTQCTETVDVLSSGEYQNGEDNPQFAIQIPADTRPARLMVQLFTPETEQLSLALFLCMSPSTRPVRLLGPVPEDRVLAKSKFVIGNTVSLEASPAGGDSPLLVLPYVSPEGTAAKLQFRFWCSNPLFKVVPLPEWRRKVVECEWDRSGGYQETAQNPQIELTTPIPNQVFVVRVHAVGASDPSLIFFVVNNHGRVGDALEGRIADDSIVAKSTYIRHHTAIKEFNNGLRPKDSYVIVPCLQPPGTSAKCVVTVSSQTEDFGLRLLKP
eukprot:CAMPEP_0174853814 /NCGR_PEP_ID=MMETSP1114-20130205/29585_1 /TAXON_ID=312471 /ORGANISM="Neobodo designis, Strain CCAP 1951/1" /LENGTH=928 /DNA_ID=CAMNT_0016088481 /DNA_START=24 /DNA_END=2810 /DNA_ORIENTATION=-